MLQEEGHSDTIMTIERNRYYHRGIVNAEILEWFAYSTNRRALARYPDKEYVWLQSTWKVTNNAAQWCSNTHKASTETIPIPTSKSKYGSLPSLPPQHKSGFPKKHLPNKSSKYSLKLKTQVSTAQEIIAYFYTFQGNSIDLSMHAMLYCAILCI